MWRPHRKPSRNSRTLGRNRRRPRRQAIEALESRKLLATDFVQTNLVSDQAGQALVQDPRLIGPWGVAEATSGGSFWVANSGSSTSTLYQGDVNGSPFIKTPVNVALPGGLPTGVAFVGNGSFQLTDDTGAVVPARFIFSSLNGNLVASPAVTSPPTGQTALAQGQIVAHVDGAVFTGLAEASVNGHSYLFAADFQHGTIDVFDTSYGQVSLAGSFTDPNLPAGYSPFNVQVLNGQIYVTYAAYTTTGVQPSDNDGDENEDNGPQNDAKDHGDGHGHGNQNDNDNDENNVPGVIPVRLLSQTGGIVDVFNLDGTFSGRLVTGGDLNAPWGLAIAPGSLGSTTSGFGSLSADLLVGNFGDGRITAVNPTNGAVDGQLANASGATISIPHLLGLTFGNGTSAGNADTLYFTAAPSGNGNGGGNANSPALIALDPSSDGAVSATGNGSVNVSDGGTLVVDSSSGSAITLNGNAEVTAGTIDIVGVPGVNANGHGAVEGIINNGAAAVADPLASLPAPDLSSLTVQQSSTLSISGHTHVTLEPGVYTGGINVTGQASVTLLPGIYYLQGGGLSVSGGGSVVGQGVMIFNAPQTANDGIGVTGHGVIDLTAPTSGTYQGIALFEARGAGSPISIDGGGSINVVGGVYAPNAVVAATGNGRLNVLSNLDDGITAQLIAYDVNVVGNGTVNVAGNQPTGGIGGVHGLFGSLQAAGSTALTTTSTTLQAVEGMVFRGAVAAFAVTAANPVASNYSAVIDWGDGNTTTGTVTATGNGGFLVLGNHTYSEEGSQNVTVTINDLSNSGNNATVTEQTRIADAPLVARGVVLPVQTDLSLNNVTLATFHDLGGAEPAGTYTATIDWGDGVTADTGTVTVNGDGTLSVLGSHTYAASGSYVVKVTIQDEGGATTTAHTLAAIGNVNPDDFFIASAFENILGRPVDEGSLQNFDNDLAHGLSRLAFANLLTHSDEFFDNKIERVYQQFLGRDADDAGLIFWRNLLGAGLTDEQLEADFIGTPEFFEHSGGTNTLWVDHMYFDLLGRAPDTAGEIFWVNALNAGAARSLVAVGFAGSAEREGIIVRGDYDDFLGRPPGASEVNGWVTAFQHGVTNEDVVAGFVASNEYFGKHDHPHGDNGGD